MLLGPLAVAALLVVGDWAVWDWAISANQEVVALVAGLLMAPLVVAVAWCAALTLMALVGIGLARTRGSLAARIAREREDRAVVLGRSGRHSAQPPRERHDERIAA